MRSEWGWRRGSGDPVCQPRIRACPIRQANAASCDCTHSWCRQGRGASRLPGQFVWPKKRPQRSRCFIQPEPRWNPGAPFPAGVPERRFRSRTDSAPVTRLRFGPCLYGLHGRHVTAGAATPRGVARRRGGTRGSWFRRARPPAAPAGESGGGRCVPFRSRIRFLFECGTFAQRRYLPPPPEGTFLPQNGAGRALPPRTSTDAPHPQSPGPPVRAADYSGAVDPPCHASPEAKPNRSRPFRRGLRPRGGRRARSRCGARRRGGVPAPPRPPRGTSASSARPGARRARARAPPRARIGRVHVKRRRPSPSRG